MKLNFPTYLTLFRVILIPLFIIIYYLPWEWSHFGAALTFFIASLTDWLDGYLARKWNQTTRFGAFLDPVADKVLVASVLVVIVQHYHTIWITIPALLMISREIIISALREWMAEIGSRNKVAVSWLGKVKTTAQMLSLIAFTWQYNSLMYYFGILALYIAVILTVWSMLQYLSAAKGSLLDELDY